MVNKAQLWSELFRIAFCLRLFAERYAVQCDEAARASEFYLGQRVRTTVGEIGLGRRPGSFVAPVGSVGTVASVPTKRDPDYAVIFDDDPSKRRHAFGNGELTPVGP